MNKLRPLALVCAGPVSRSPLARLPHLRSNLGWVKSTSYRIASRAVNALGAGVPVSEIAEMAPATVWIVSVPAEELQVTLAGLYGAGLDWRGRVLLILDSKAGSEHGTAFHKSGAAVASFTPIDPECSRYMVEGDGDAIRVVRSLIGDSHKRLVVQIAKGSKARFLEGAEATSRVLPLIAEAIDRFQDVGISKQDAKAVTESLLTGAMRLYFRAGRRALHK
jgi:hypothetical protein